MPCNKWDGRAIFALQNVFALLFLIRAIQFEKFSNVVFVTDVIDLLLKHFLSGVAQQIANCSGTIDIPPP